MPAKKKELWGPCEVRVDNPTAQAVMVGLRSRKGGTDLLVPAHGVTAGHVPSGHYEVYFVYLATPDKLFKGESISVDIGDILVGDYNGDGNQDISTILPFGGGIIGGGMGVTFNTRFGDGLGTFGPVVMASASSVSAVSATVADLDENGRDDYILSGIAEHLVIAAVDGCPIVDRVIGTP